LFDSKRNAIILLLVAFVFALVSGLLFMNFVKTSNAKMGAMTTYYVATKDILPRIELKAGDFKPVEMPERYAPANLVTDLKSYEGAVTAVPLSKGDALEKNILKQVAVSANGANSRLVRLMASKQIQFESSLEPLDRVDIIVSYLKAPNTPVTEVVMSNVPVATIYTGNPNDPNSKAQNDTQAQLLGIAVDIDLAGACRIFQFTSSAASTIHILKANIIEQPKK
jgi:Flp pilus assembly protein CpaB